MTGYYAPMGHGFPTMGMPGRMPSCSNRALGPMSPKGGERMRKAPVPTRPYEAVYVVNPTFEEEQLDATIERFQEHVKSFGGEVSGVEKLDKKRLAYEVMGHREGYYVVMKFTAGPKAPSELERVFKLSDDILRFIVVRLDEK